MNGKILIIAAHPDDEILGCGATAARLSKEGKEIYCLILGEGKTARLPKRKKSQLNKELRTLKKEMLSANNLIGVKKVYSYNFPDNRFDSIDLLDIIKKVSGVLEKIKPETIFTHFEKDLNIDHRLTYQAVITATRPLPNQFVREIFSFESISSTEWSFPLSFSPDIFFDVSKTIEIKLNAMREYSSELLDPPHPRSIEEIKINAKYWGMRNGVGYAEAFKLVRSLK